MKLAPEDLKVFISYRHDDTRELAHQLFDALNRKHFEVFLDSYSVESGVDFQKRIAQQLADKAMVVILESPELTNSKWVMEEIDFARIHRLGFCALHVQDVNSAKLRDIDDENREDLISTDFIDPNLPMEERILKPGKLEQVVGFIRKRHMMALFLKHRDLRSAIEGYLEDVNKGMPIEVENDENGFITINKKGSDKATVALAIRPCGVREYYQVNTLAGSKAKSFIIGPPFHEKERRLHNDWLSQRSDVDFIDEGQLYRLGEAINKL